MRTIPRIHRTDHDFAVAWSKMYGKGRVFYSTLGHTEEAWEDPDIRKMYFEAIKWSLGMTEGSTTSHPRPARVPMSEVEPDGNEGGVTRMKKFRDLAFLAAIAGLAAYQGRQLHIYAATGQAPATHAKRGTYPRGQCAAAQSAELAAAGGSLFQQNCAFCHGRDAGGGETGPDLTRSKLVTADVGGDKIGDVVLHGRPDKGMPAFQFSSEQITELAAFIHSQQTKAMAQSGKRKGVDVSDLQTGNVEAGKAYFNGPGGCATCHSPTGDLAGIASTLRGAAAGGADAVPQRCEEQGDGDAPFGRNGCRDPGVSG